MEDKQWTCTEMFLAIIQALKEINQESNFQLLSDETATSLMLIENELREEIKETQNDSIED